MNRVQISKPAKARTPRWAVPGSCATPGVGLYDKPHYEQGTVLPDPAQPYEPPRLDWQEVRMPEQFRGMDIDYRGYPIPYTLHPGKLPPDRKVDFRVLNVARHLRCAEYRLCAICGRDLGPRLVFIGGPMCVQGRVFGDGPVHEACARYALRVCPYLSIGPKTYSERPIQAPKLYGTTSFDPNVIKDKPERIVAYHCKQYRLLNLKGQGKPVFIAEPPFAVDWFTNDGNYLCRTRPDRFSQ